MELVRGDTPPPNLPLGNVPIILNMEKRRPWINDRRLRLDGGSFMWAQFPPILC